MEYFSGNYGKIFTIGTTIGLSTYLFNRYWINRRSYFNDQIRLDGKTILITGGNAGIGYATAKDLLQRGGRILLGCRNLSRGVEAMKNLRKETNCPEENLRLIRLDLSSFRSIDEFVREIERTENSLNLIICNAGLTTSNEKLTEDQFDFVLQSNYLGHFLLCERLRRILSRSSPSRIIHVSSDLHRLVKSIDLTNEENLFRQLDDQSLMGTYPLSKFFQILSTKTLRDEYRLDQIEMFCVTPGWVSTSIDDPLKHRLPRIFLPIYLIFDFVMKSIFSRTSTKGAETIVFVSIDRSISQSNQFFYQNLRPSSISSLIDHENLSRRFVDLTRKCFPDEYLSST